MVNTDILIRLEGLVPERKRSDLVNELLESAIIRFSRKKAVEGMEELRKKNKLSMTTEEMIKLKNYGRE